MAAEVGDCRQEIVCIGVGIDRASIERLFDGAIVTDEEHQAGPTKWVTWPDELPGWDLD